MAYGAGWAIEESEEFDAAVEMYFGDDSRIYDALEAVTWLLRVDPRDPRVGVHLVANLF